MNTDKNLNGSYYKSSTGEEMFTTGEEDKQIVDFIKNSRDNHVKIANKLNDPKSKKSNDLDYEYIREKFGSFYFCFYNKLIDTNYVFRYLYLSTFMNYKNYIVWGVAKKEEQLATKNDLFEILKLSRRETYNTINYLIDNNLIEIENNYIKINPKYCKRGNAKIMKNETIRIFDNAIQELYNNSNAKEHKKIGLLITLLPYVHYDTNIICSNPSEEHEELIQPLNQKQILEILGVSKPTALSLMSIKICNGEESAFIKVSNVFYKNFYVINPRFSYQGSDLRELEKLTSLFKAMRKSKKKQK